MYCTGGVRCEMASALVRRQCDSTGTEVLQLSGGIERYLQAYPCRAVTTSTREGSEGRGVCADDGGGVEGGRVCGGMEAGREGKGGGQGTGDESFFRGKNFVFDERCVLARTVVRSSFD